MPRQTLKQRSDGRYRVKYKGREFYGNTQSEALEKREVFKQELARGLRANALGITFLDYSSQWLPAYKANCADKTYNDYVRIINHACQRIGALPIKEITATEIRLLFNEISGKSQSYINKYCMTINSVFAAALNDHIILSNPCHKLRRPKGHAGTHRAITEAERKLIVESVVEHEMALAALIMLYAGLRRGEVLALNLDRDVDLAKGRIYVRHAVSFGDENQPRTGSPKTESGMRAIPIFSQLLPALENAHGLVLRRENGQPMSRSAFLKKWSSYLYYLETKMNGCSKRWYGKTREHVELIASGGQMPQYRRCTIRPHDLRHTFCTTCRDAGVDIQDVINWMGHADEKMIMRIYDHSSAARESRSIRNMELYLHQSDERVKMGVNNE